jgi:hypothetical protein
MSSPSTIVISRIQAGLEQGGVVESSTAYAFIVEQSEQEQAVAKKRR